MNKFPEKSKQGKAQELAYDAMECMHCDDKKVVKLCKDALKLYPDCVDAQVMLAEIQSESVEDYIQAMKKAVASGRKELGEDCFKNDVGYFWGLLETRPFMRAMGQLADGYRQMGKQGFPKAIEIYEEMLRLNPNDNQGVRYLLIGCYLAQKLYKETENLIEKYKDDSMAVFNWAKVLYCYVTEGEDAAEKVLKSAIEQNQYVLGFLTGKKSLPQYMPGSYSRGNEDEAIICIDSLDEAWKSHPEAQSWLKDKV